MEQLLQLYQHNNYEGLKEIVFYKNGMKNGESNEYNDLGFLINKSFYVDDKKEGWETEYYYKYEDDKYEGLKIAYEVFYKNGKKQLNITVIMSLEKLVKKFFTKMEKRR